MTASFKNLVEIQQHACRTHPERDMYGTRDDHGFTWITYGEFGQQVEEFRGGLASLGVSRGDKVAIISSNCIEWPVCAYATYGLSANFVPMYESQEPTEWEYILRDSGSKILLARTKEVYKKVKDFSKKIDTLEIVVPMFGCPDAPTDMARLRDVGCHNPAVVVYPAPNEPMGLIYTSGTTGNPKGVILSHKNLITELEALASIGDDVVRPDDRGLSFLPWGHLMGQIQEVHLLMYIGFSSALVRDINEIVMDLSLAKPTLFFSVPRLFNKIFENVTGKIETRGKAIRFLYEKGLAGARGENNGLLDPLFQKLADVLIFRKIRALFGGRLRYAISGGASLNPDVIKFLDCLGLTVLEGYGLTETTMAVTLNVPGFRKPGSVGRPVPGARVEIDKSIGDTHPDEGEIVAYGDLIMQGYHNLPEETRATIDPDGGLRTGDIGRFDEDGFLYITGRIKEIYKLENGKYVSPSPLEEQLKMSPYIAQALITGANRLHNIALLIPEMAAIEEYARNAGLDVAQADWQTDPAVESLFKEEVEKYSTEFKRFEKLPKFKVLWDDWSTENGFLTPTLKLKRRQITEKYKEVIEQLYKV